jgi:hypothetical protein
VAVTSAQFVELLRGQSGAQTVILAEIKYAYQTAAGPAEGTFYLSDGEYRTKEGESPARTAYLDLIMDAPAFTRSIDLAKLGGRGTMTPGDLKLSNMDGESEFLLDHILDGREIRFYAGRGGDHPWPRADFRLVGVALVASVKAGEEALTITLLDKNYLLDDTVVGDAIATGPNAGKPKPILLGAVKNFDLTPYLLDQSTLTYAINNFALSAATPSSYVAGLRDGGLDLFTGFLFEFGDFSFPLTVNLATETLTYTGHQLAVDDVILFRDDVPGTIFTGLAQDTQYWVIAAGLTANDFRLSLARGGAAVNITGGAVTGTWHVERRRFYVDAAAATVSLSAQPTYRAMFDVSGLDAAGVITQGRPHEIFKYLLANYSSLAAVEYDAAALAAMIALEVTEDLVGSFSILDRRNLLDIFDAIAQSTCSWYAWTSAGVLTVGRLDLANLDSAVPIDSLSRGDVWEGELQCENLPVPWGRVFVDWVPNSSPQQDGFSPLVSDQIRTIFSRPYQSRRAMTDPAGTTYVDNWWDYHKSAIDSKPIGLALSHDANGGLGGVFVADKIAALFAPWTRVYRLTVGLDKYALNPGDCVRLTYPRFGLDAGKNMRVISVRTRLSDGTCDLVLVRREIPDYTA